LHLPALAELLARDGRVQLLDVTGAKPQGDDADFNRRVTPCGRCRRCLPAAS